MRDGIAEDDEQAIALGGSDVPFVARNDAQHLVSVSADEEAIGFGLDLGRQNRRIDEVGEHDRQPPDLAGLARCGEQILGVGVALIDRKHVPRNGIGGFLVAAVYGRYRVIQQIVYRCTGVYLVIGIGESGKAQRRCLSAW